MATEWMVFLCLHFTTMMTTNVIAAGSGYYRAAVVELRPPSGSRSYLNDLGTYERYIRDANTQGVDIIVFPEAGLYGSDYSTFYDIPDPSLKIVPAYNASYREVIKQLSRLAIQNSMYIAVNLLENCNDASEGIKKYNTNVVFDRTGAVVARYRKFNVYGEPVDRTAQFEPSYFDSDFGVRFGQLIGLDILYKEPLILKERYNITDFIYSSEWFSGLPFLTAAQTQWMFSFGNDVNLLSAGLNRIDSGSSGSGIFRGRNTPIGFLFIFGDVTLNGMVVGNVPIGGPKADYSDAGDYAQILRPGDGHGQIPFPLLRQNELDLMANENVELSSGSSSFVKQICQGSLCCNFELVMSYQTPTDVMYKAVVFDGVRTSNAHRTKLVQGVQVCGVVMCSNTSITSCGPPAVNWHLPNTNTKQPTTSFHSIKISGNFTAINSSVAPNVLLWPMPLPGSSPWENRAEYLVDPRTVQFINKKHFSFASLFLQPNKKIISSGIFSRVFSRDARITTNTACWTVPSLAKQLSFVTLAIYLSFGVLQ